MQAARAAGARVLVLDTLVPQATALVLLDAAGGFIRQFSEGKADPALENGLITQDDLPSASDRASPWIALFRQLHDAYEPQAPFDDITVYAMASAFTFTEALRAAGPRPARRSLLAALVSGAVNADGPGLAPFDFSPVNLGPFRPEAQARV